MGGRLGDNGIEPLGGMLGDNGIEPFGLNARGQWD